jgi:hypothetical protein
MPLAVVWSKDRSVGRNAKGEPGRLKHTEGRGENSGEGSESSRWQKGPQLSTSHSCQEWQRVEGNWSPAVNGRCLTSVRFAAQSRRPDEARARGAARPPNSLLELPTRAVPQRRPRTTAGGALGIVLRVRHTRACFPQHHPPRSLVPGFFRPQRSTLPPTSCVQRFTATRPLHRHTQWLAGSPLSTHV